MKKVIIFFVLFAFVCVFFYSGYRILSKVNEYKQVKENYDEIAQLVVQTVPATTKSTENTEAEITVPSESEPKPTASVETTAPTEAPSPYADMVAPIIVDFETLQGINPDIVGWLYCEGTSINYPVLKGETNDTYLRHQYDGKYNYGGSIFMDYRCDAKLADPYTMIFGHNMSSDTMFHALDSFRKQSFLDKHSRFFYLTPSGENFCLEVICSNLTKYKDELRLFELLDDTRNLELIRSKAFADSGIVVSDGDKLVLLATCAYDYKNARCTLLCKVFPIAS